MTTSTKITKATFKSFIKKNIANLYVLQESTFDGMTDCVQFTKSTFSKAVITDKLNTYNFSVDSVWIVGGSSNYFSTFDDGQFVGISYSNACGSGVIAIKKV